MVYIELDRLPSVIIDNTFDENGFVETDKGPMVPVYVASQMGFNEPGKKFLADFYQKLEESRILPLCPFKACGEYLDLDRLTDKTLTVAENEEAWQDFNDHVGPVNYETLMPNSKGMIAILDGGHAIDDGVASECGYYAREHGPIMAIRSDIRLAENISALINPALRYFFDNGPYGGELFLGPEAYEQALKCSTILANEMLDGPQFEF